MASALTTYLREALEARGWSVYRLVNAVGRSPTALYGLMRDDPTPVGEDLLRDIAGVLGLDAEWLLILSGDQYERESPRWKYSQVLRECRSLREENESLRAKLAEARVDAEDAVHV